HRADLAGAALLDAVPLLRWQRLDGDGDVVYLRPADQGRHLRRLDLKIDHRAVADVRAAARQAVGEVAVRLQVVAPRLAPERGRDPPAGDDEGRNGLPLLPALLDLTGRLRLPLGDRDVRTELEPHRGHSLSGEGGMMTLSVIHSTRAPTTLSC